MSVTATGTPSVAGRTPCSGTGTSRGCGSPLCRDERRGAPGSWGGCDELVWMIRGLAGRGARGLKSRGAWWSSRSGLRARGLGDGRHHVGSGLRSWRREALSHILGVLETRGAKVRAQVFWPWSTAAHPHLDSQMATTCPPTR